MTPAEALNQLYAALAAVPGVRLYRGAGVTIDPPASGCASAVGPPRLQRTGMGSEPTEATFQVAVIVPKNERAFADLMRWESVVAAAIDQLEDAVVRDSNSGVWPSGGVDLPAYVINVDWAL